MKINQRVFQMVTIVALFIAVVFISVGFALMSTQLRIQGTAKVIPASWEVKFGNYEFKNNSTAADHVDTNLSKTDTTFANYQIVLTKPGDHGTYEIEVKNTGDIDAELTSVVWDDSTLSYTGTAPTAAADEALVTGKINYTLTWKDTGAAPVLGDTLAHNSTRIIVIDVIYSDTATEMPANPVTIEGKDLTMTFSQASASNSGNSGNSGNGGN